MIDHTKFLKVKHLLEEAIKIKNNTTTNFLHCLIKLYSILFQDLEYLKVIEKDY